MTFSFKKSTTYGISYLNGDMLEIVFLKASGHHYEVVAKEAIPTEAGLDREGAAQFRNRLEAYRSRNPIWLHLMGRNAALAKVLVLPQVSSEEMESVVANQIGVEIPYLQEEVLLHHSLQKRREERSAHAVLFGIPKDVLMEQMRLLEACGVVPDRVLLSTEILAWWYRTQAHHSEASDGAKLLVNLFSRQAELLFFDRDILLQSRWVAWGDDASVNLKEAIQSYSDSFQREWRRRPSTILVLGDDHGDVEALARDTSRAVEDVSLDSDSSLPPLIALAVRAYQCGDLFDFTLPEAKENRSKKKRSRELAKLFLSVACFSFSLFLLMTVQVSTILGQMGWLHFQLSGLRGSVKEVRQLRTKALTIQDFRARKLLPVLLIADLRSAIADDLLLNELEYDEVNGTFHLEGSARDQNAVDQFIEALTQHAMVQHVALERIQSERGREGTTNYAFELKGGVNRGRFR